MLIIRYLSRIYIVQIYVTTVVYIQRIWVDIDNGMCILGSWQTLNKEL